MEPTSTLSTIPYDYAGFDTVTQALDYAARGQAGVNFYSARGGLESAFSYAEIRETAMRQARELVALGLNREDRVGIIADMSVDFVTLFLACQYAGLLAVPLPYLTGLGGRQEYETQLSGVIRTSGVDVVLGPEISRSSLQKAVQGLDLKLLGTARDLHEQSPGNGVLNPLDRNEPSHIQFSSGSTRNPLGVLIFQKALLANARSVAHHGLKFREGDRVASWLPFYHDMGLIGFFLIPLTCQLSIDYISTEGFARRPLSWLDIISRNRATITFSPTFGYEICSRRAARADDLDLDLSCLRVAGIGGDMVQPNILAEFANTFEPYGFDPGAFVPSYGMAEATLAFSFSSLDEGVQQDAVRRQPLIEDGHALPPTQSDFASDDKDSKFRVFAKCGRPMPGYDVQIRDGSGSVLKDREIGNIYIKGPSLMTCYDRNTDATDAVMADDHWLNTGDMGYLVDDTLVITGRMKDLIIINGRNIWPQDLEWHAEEEIDLLKSRTTAAFSVERPDNNKEEAVILVQCRTHDPDQQQALKQDVKAVIFRNAGIDAKVVLIPNGSLPFTTSGKLSRTKAKINYLKGRYEIIGENESEAAQFASVSAATGQGR